MHHPGRGAGSGRTPAVGTGQRASAREGVRGRADALQRQYVLVAGVMAVMILGIIFLFGHLISRSLSRHYLETVLLAGREEADRLAGQMVPGEGATVYDVVEKRREVLEQKLSELANRLVFTSITVTDRDGNVVYEAEIRSRERLPEGVVGDLDVGPGLPDSVVRETEKTYQIPAPIGDVGEVVLTMSKGRLAERISSLRRDLLRQTVTVAGVTLLTLLGAFAFVWHLIQRTRRLEDQRREAEELAALGELAANLAHEIRNPLNSINLNLELLEEDLAAGTAAPGDSLASTRKEVGRLARLVTDFLTYARPTGSRRNPVDLAGLVREVVAFLRPEARDSLVHLRVEADLPRVTVVGDEGQLRQVVINLVLNAVQAVEGLEPDRRVVEVGLEEEEGEDGAVAMVVRDRGLGIPEQDLGKVRQAFYTSRPGGTGLGLAVAERVARSHGGRIELRNVDGGGFEARVVLPRAEGDVKMDRAPAAPGGGRGRNA